jgi:magnesium transporter
VTDTVEKKRPPAEPDGTHDEAGYVLEPDFVKAVVEATEEGASENLKQLLEPIHYADVADLLQGLDPDIRSALVDAIRAEFDPRILAELDETVRDEVITQLGVDDVASVLSALDSDDAIDLVEQLEPEQQREILEAVPDIDRTLIEQGLTYPEDSAGRLMQREMVTVPNVWTVGDTIDFMRRAAEEEERALPEQFYDLYVVDPGHRPMGAVALSRLLRSKRPVPVADIMTERLTRIPVTMDQEEVAFIFRQRDLVSAAVIDDSERLVGSITIDDVVDVIEEEHEEDIMHLGGVRTDDLYRAIIDTTRFRFPWLLVNLVTAVVASVVISLFQSTIEKMVALAVLMPIVASMGGNAGTQSLTVAVRALATKELTSTNAFRVIGKELIVGGSNGILFAVLTGMVGAIWFASIGIGAVMALAMIVTLLVAGFAGTTIPLVLARSGVDPAIASGVLLTTITDVIGFFTFLGLAAWLLF